MKRFFLFLCLAAVPVLFASCSVPQYVSAQADYNAYWSGRSYADIIKAYGAPSRETSDGSDGAILIYERSMVETTTSSDYPMYGYGPYFGYRGWWGGFGPTIRTTTATTNDYVHFYVNADNKCYQVRTNQVKEDGQRIDPSLTFMACLGGVTLGSILLRIIFPVF